MPYNRNEFGFSGKQEPCCDCGQTDFVEDHQNAELVCYSCGCVQQSGMSVMSFVDADQYSPLPTEEGKVFYSIRKRLHQVEIPDENLKMLSEVAIDVKKKLGLRDWADAIYVAIMWCSRNGDINAISKSAALNALNISFVDQARADANFGRYSEAKGGIVGTGSRARDCYRVFTSNSDKLALGSGDHSKVNLAAMKLIHKLPSIIINNKKSHMICAAVADVVLDKLKIPTHKQYINFAFEVSVAYKKLLKEVMPYQTA